MEKKNAFEKITDLFKSDLGSGGVTGIVVLLTLCVVLTAIGYGALAWGRSLVAANQRPLCQEQAEFKEQMTMTRQQVREALEKLHIPLIKRTADINIDDAEPLRRTEDAYLLRKFSETEQILLGIDAENEEFDATEHGRKAKRARSIGTAFVLIGKGIIYPSLFMAVIFIVQLVMVPFALKD